MGGFLSNLCNRQMIQLNSGRIKFELAARVRVRVSLLLITMWCSGGICCTKCRLFYCSAKPGKQKNVEIRLCNYLLIKYIYSECTRFDVTWTKLDISIVGMYSVPAQETAKHHAKFGWPPVSDVTAVTKARRARDYIPDHHVCRNYFHIITFM